MYGEGGPPGHQGKPPDSVCALRSFASAASRSAFAIARIEHVARGRRPASGRPAPSRATASPRAPSCGWGRRASQVSSGVSRLDSSARHLRDRRVVAEERGDDAGRDEAVQRLLGALVGVVDEVRQRREHRVEELRVDRDDELLVDRGSGRRSSPGPRTSASAARRPRSVDEPRLREVHAARQDRHRPQLAVGEVAGGGRRLDRVGADALGRGQTERRRWRRRRPPRERPPSPARARGRTPRARSCWSRCRGSRARRRPTAPWSEALLTTTLSSAGSPSRRKRGT